jgi:hypothetical protein
MRGIAQLLSAAAPAELLSALADAHREMEENYRLERWKTAQLDAGHFVEAVRRIIERELFGGYTPIGTSLPSLNYRELERYERATGDESMRVLIPRVLLAMYSVRNKRGVAHLGAISPNEMDAAIIVRSGRWVLAELVRLKGGLAPDEATAVVQALTEKDVPLVWSVDGVDRVLDPTLPARDQVLILLHARSPRSIADLQQATEYQNTTNFRKLLKRLHVDRLIEMRPTGACHISLLGIRRAEALLLGD